VNYDVKSTKKVKKDMDIDDSVSSGESDQED
jgi:hypothetical protein